MTYRQEQGRGRRVPNSKRLRQPQGLHIGKKIPRSGGFPPHPAAGKCWGRRGVPMWATPGSRSTVPRGQEWVWWLRAEPWFGLTVTWRVVAGGGKAGSQSRDTQWPQHSAQSPAGCSRGWGGHRRLQGHLQHLKPAQPVPQGLRGIYRP